MRSMLCSVIAVCALAATGASAQGQDPANSWLAYAVAQCPQGQRLTEMRAEWTVSRSAKNFTNPNLAYCAWFGSDTTDNLDLIQPVNPWYGSSWEVYTEHFQWQPIKNWNSPAVPISSGQHIAGSLRFLGEDKQQYRMENFNLDSGLGSVLDVNVQKAANSPTKSGQQVFKNYSYMYVVYEQHGNPSCDLYPPAGSVNFHDIQVQCDGKDFVPTWEFKYVNHPCKFRASSEDPTSVTLSWDVNGNNTEAESFLSAKQMATPPTWFKPPSKRQV